MRYKRSVGEKIFDSCLYLFLVIFIFTIIFPFIEMVLTSIAPEYLAASRRVFQFNEFTIANWRLILTNSVIWTSVRVTLTVTLSATLLGLLLTSAYAYPLSRRYLPNRVLWTIVLLIPMFFSGGLVPTYLLMSQLRLVDSLWVLILGGGVSIWNTLILRNFFLALPEDVLESARVDGASEVTIYFRMVLPMSKAVLATVTLWNLVGNWNSWVSCLIYIQDREKRVLQIVLRQLIQSSARNVLERGGGTYENLADGRWSTSVEGMIAATTVFITIPILLSYPYLQKHFVKGILMGSLKG